MIIYSSDIVYIHVLTVLHILGLTPRSRRNLATFTSPTLQASINGVKSPSEIMIEKSFNVHSEKMVRGLTRLLAFLCCIYKKQTAIKTQLSEVLESIIL